MSTAKTTDYSYDPGALVATPTRGLAHWMRAAQKRERLAMLRQWWAAGFDEDAVLRMGMAHFVLPPSAVTNLIKELVDLIDDEADAWESQDKHQIRHRHRIRFTQLYQRAVKANQFSVAERAARALAQLDGAFKLNDANDELVKTVHQQGARILSDSDVARLLTGEAEKIDVAVPTEPEQADG